MSRYDFRIPFLIEILVNIRPKDNKKLYLCDQYANVNADILTAFYSPLDIDIEIIFTQNVIELQPTNECCRFVQRIRANKRTMPICRPILSCTNAFTCIYITSDHDNLKTLKCYRLSLEEDKIRILKRRTILINSISIPHVVLEYNKHGFVTAYEKQDKTTVHWNSRFSIITNPYYDCID